MTTVERLAELPARWRARAAALRPYVPRAATAWEEVAHDLELLNRILAAAEPKTKVPA